ncbi:MAG: hypothetical protein MH204_07730 [Fimbriimonadaceae bacterium]|nr:hypothetical protein [Fimbriimonadaceae bacterium]
MKRSLPLLLALPAVILLAAGCGQSGISKDELDAAAESKPPTPEQMQRVRETMAQGAADAQKQQSDWAAGRSPEEIARINAERAKMGRPPLGGG